MSSTQLFDECVVYLTRHLNGDQGAEPQSWTVLQNQNQNVVFILFISGLRKFKHFFTNLEKKNNQNIVYWRGKIKARERTSKYQLLTSQASDTYYNKEIF